jgi:predicted O-methyltransferase YrrM
MTSEWIESVFAHPELLTMGHGQRLEDRNLGLGWLYYALVRVERPRTVVCIGSWRGFVPIMLGKALKDNHEGGKVIFIDPSLVDAQWTDPKRTEAWFAGFGLDNIHHFRMTTQAFTASNTYQSMETVNLLFVDGFHSAEQARFDHEAFEPLLSADAVVLFHDSVRKMTSRIYGQDKPYEHTVVDYIDELKARAEFQIMDFSLDSGVTMVRRAARNP